MATSETTLDITTATGASSVALVVEEQHTSAAASTLSASSLQQKAAGYEGELKKWLQSTEPYLPALGGFQWALETFSYSGGEKASFLIQLVRAARSGDAGAIAEVKAAAEKAASNTVSVLNTVSIVAALFLVLLYSQLFNPNIAHNFSLKNDEYFSDTNLTTFKAFFYGLLNLSFLLCVFLLVSNFRTTTLLNSWLQGPFAKIDYFATHSPLQCAYTTLTLAALAFLAAIPFAFALLVTPASALASMIFYVVSVPLAFLYITYGGNEGLSTLRAQAKAALGQADV